MAAKKQTGATGSKACASSKKSSKKQSDCGCNSTNDCGCGGNSTKSASK